MESSELWLALPLLAPSQPTFTNVTFRQSSETAGSLLLAFPALFLFCLLFRCWFLFACFSCAGSLLIACPALTTSQSTVSVASSHNSSGKAGTRVIFEQPFQRQKKYLQWRCWCLKTPVHAFMCSLQNDVRSLKCSLDELKFL